MSIKSKLLLLIMLPLMGFLIMSVEYMMKEYSVKTELEKLDVGVELSIRLSKLVHETQKERGMTAGYLGSKGVKFADKLPAQRELTNKRIVILKTFVNNNDVKDVSLPIANRLKFVFSDIAKLNMMREKIDNLSISGPEAIKYYTNMNKDILNTVVEVSKISQVADISKKLVAYANFLFSKEKAGVERAVGTNSLAKDKFAEGMRIKFNNLISAQKSYMNIFLLYSSDKTKSFYAKTLQGKSIDEVERIRAILLNSTKKKKLVSQMKELVGYGGLIHNFKNYVIRGDEKYAQKVQKQYKELMRLVKQYKALPHLTKEEISLLNKVVSVFTKYNNGLQAVARASKTNMSVKRLDKIVKVSDAPAINALNKLDNSFFADSANYWFNMITQKINKLKIVDDYLSDNLIKTINKKLSDVESGLWTFTILNAIAIIIVMLISLYLLKDIFSKLLELNKATENLLTSHDTSSRIKVTSHDEIGVISENMNKYLQSIEDSIAEDNKLIQSAKATMERVNRGWYSETIQGHTSNQTLEDFKDSVNNMINATRQHFVEVNDILDQYAKYDYRQELKLDNIEKGGVFELLVSDINTLRNAITEMLIENKRNGLTLDKSSNILLENVATLNKNSNSSAAALEETAAALEEVTGNISSNTQNIVKMAGYANELTKSSSIGKELAQQTTQAMNEIDQEVNAINEAITVIDQIAFQTNILSLNAAVEAATAGEAGKGFAVVAQEVRNLASRSAEAANEIKTLVTNATDKANYGKGIADKMIEGYSGLNNNITKTIEIISDVEMSSKEQLQGIEQINDAINSLDQQTQQNAMIASQTNDIAIQTDRIAKLVVANANEKEFIGKDDVVSDPMDTPSQQTTIAPVETTSIASTQVSSKVVKSKEPINEIIANNDDDDEWASF